MCGVRSHSQTQLRTPRIQSGFSPLARHLAPSLQCRSSDDHDTGFHDHDVSAGAVAVVTIHAYSPPLWRMGAYEIRSEGRLLRHSVSYAEELRPIGAVA